LPEHQGPGFAIGDLNDDGYWDGVLSIRSAGTQILHNDGTGALVPSETAEATPDELPEANSVALADMDNDGDLDLAMATQDGHPNLILINQGNGTQWETLELEDSLDESLTPTWADLNGDNRLDLILPGFGHDFPAPEGRTHSVYFQRSDGSFELDRSVLPEGSRTGMAYIAQPFDVDLDGDLDLYWVNDLPFDSQLHLNDGSGVFSDHSDECLCTEVLSAMGVAIGDPNQDGLPDFFVTGWQENRFFVNDADSRFFDAAEATGLNPAHRKSEVGWGVRFTDFNLDGRPDLAGTFGGPTHDPADHPKIEYAQADALWIADKDGGFTDRAGKAKWSTRALGRGLFVADMNRDGRPDIVLATNIGMEIWLSSGGCGESLSLRLHGGPGDPHGEGARVKITLADGSVHYEWMQSAVSFGNGAPELYLGNPKANKIESLEVQWADGLVQAIPIPKDASAFSFWRE
jgi:enediyne biosynthesis protein E4